MPACMLMRMPLAMAAGFVVDEDQHRRLCGASCCATGSYETCAVRPVQRRIGGAQRIRLYPLQRRLRRYQPQLEERFHSALDELRIELPDLGQVQALDGKELDSLAKGQSTYPLPKDTSQKDTDGRRDRDADWGVKGSGERKHYWFGYLLHLVVDATYEVPLAFEVTKASTAEQPQA